MNIAILILAAGQSSRMGKPKQLLKVGDQTLLQQSIETALASGGQIVYCVIGAHAEAIKADIETYSVQIVENQNYQQGLSTSMIAGIEALENEEVDGVLIMLADQPKMTTRHLNDLIGLFDQNADEMVATAYDNGLGVPAIFARRHFSQLKSVTGDKGARVILNKHKGDVHSLPFADLSDIDTPEDYQKLLQSFSVDGQKEHGGGKYGKAFFKG